MARSRRVAAAEPRGTAPPPSRSLYRVPCAFVINYLDEAGGYDLRLVCNCPEIDSPRSQYTRNPLKTKEYCKTIVMQTALGLPKCRANLLIPKYFRPCNPMMQRAVYLLPSAGVICAVLLALSVRTRGGFARLIAANCLAASSLWAIVSSGDSAICINTRSRRWIRVIWEGIESLDAGGVRSVAER